MLLDHQPCLIFLNVVPKNCIVNLNLVPNFIFHVDHVKSCILLFLFQNLQDSFYEKKMQCVCVLHVKTIKLKLFVLLFQVFCVQVQ